MNAGAGALAVTVDGPSKVQLDCREVSEGIDLLIIILISMHYSF
jgi:filamin